MFIPSRSSGLLTEHVATATQDTVSVLAPGKGILSTLDHVIGGKISCMDCTADRLALGVGSYGYGTLGNKVIHIIKQHCSNKHNQPIWQHRVNFPVALKKSSG